MPHRCHAIRSIANPVDGRIGTDERPELHYFSIPVRLAICVDIASINGGLSASNVSE
jgi:hypothetical protein